MDEKEHLITLHFNTLGTSFVSDHKKDENMQNKLLR